MSCYFPIALYPQALPRRPRVGGIPLGSVKTWDRLNGEPVKVPCGRCIGCRLEYSRQWAIRCVNESKVHEENSFLTLTYREEELVWGNSRATLYPRDLQLFMKRLRKEVDKPKALKFYACGEYGELNQRPHYHMCLFGHEFKDAKIAGQRKGIKYYASETLDRIWGHGSCIIGEVNFETAAYVARYVVAKKTGEQASFYEREGIEPEFVRMSRRPGIGSEWYDKYSGDVYPHDYMVIRNGIKCRPVKYYNDKYGLKNPTEMLRIKEARKLKAEKSAKDNTIRRLADKRKVKEAQLAMLARTV